MDPIYFVLLLLGMILVLFTGIPVAFGLGGVAIISTLFIWGPDGLMTIANSAFSNFTATTYIAIPMFFADGKFTAKIRYGGRFV